MSERALIEAGLMPGDAAAVVESVEMREGRLMREDEIDPQVEADIDDVEGTRTWVFFYGYFAPELLRILEAQDIEGFEAEQEEG